MPGHQRPGQNTRYKEPHNSSLDLFANVAMITGYNGIEGLYFMRSSMPKAFKCLERFLKWLYEATTMPYKAL